MSRHAQPSRRSSLRVNLACWRARHFPHLLGWAVTTAVGSAVLAADIWMKVHR